MRVLAAMSGGVDSAVAAARVADAGHDVTGVHLALARNPRSHRTGARGCCTLEDARDARRAADVIGIPFYVWDLAARFAADVMDDFVAEYAAGHTPNPCVRCNERIKFAAVLDRALALGFDAVCTGHYARIVDGPRGRSLHRARDTGKDQSYVLGVLTPEQLAHAIFPLGDTPKPQVRAEAARRGLTVADKPDSHDVCFVPDGDTAGWLRERLGPAPGEVVDEAGAVLGRHDGAYAYTVGQRRGLRLGTPSQDGRPRYVLAVSPVRRTVTVGPAEALDVWRVDGVGPRWFGPRVDRPMECLAQLRAHGEAVPAVAELVSSPPAGAAPDGSPAVRTGEGRGPAAGDLLRVHLRRPVRGVAPGQAIVVYDGDRVLAAATVDTTSAASA